MKLIWGLLGIVIFAVSLPSASETLNGNHNAYRVVFFNKLVPSPACAIADSAKVNYISSMEISNPNSLQLVGGEITYVRESDGARLKQGVVNAVTGYCTTQGSTALKTQIAQDQVDANIKARNDALAASNAQALAAQTAAAAAAKRAEDERRAAAATANSASTRTAALTGIKAANDEYKSATRPSSRDGGASNGGTRDNTTRAEGSSERSAPAANGSAAAGVPAKGPAAPAAAKEQFVVSDNGSTVIDTKSKTVSVPHPETGEMSSYTYDPKTQTFESPGRVGLTYDQMVAQAQTCTGDCASALAAMKANPETATTAADLATKGSPTDAKTAGQLAAIKDSTAALGKQTATVLNLASGTDCTALAQSVNTAAQAYVTQMGTCASTASKTENMCSLVRSPKAVLVQKLMSVGSLIISRKSSASDTCNSAQEFSRMAQMGLTAANVACTGMKMLCDSNCVPTEAQLQTLTAGNAKLQACATNLAGIAKVLHAKAATLAAGIATSASAPPVEAKAVKYDADFTRVQSAVQNLGVIISQQQPIPKQQIATCEKYEADILNMALQIVSVADANKAAKACKDALTKNGEGEGGGGGTTTSDVSMDEFCKVPGQAVNPPCLCRTQPTAHGCPGYVAQTTTTTTTTQANGGGVNTSNTGGASAMAAPGGMSALPTIAKKTGLSAEAKAALGVDSGLGAQDENSGSNAGMNGATDSNNNGNGSGGGGSNKLTAGSAGELGKNGKSDKKNNLGQYQDIGGSMGGGFGFGAGGVGANGKKYSAEEIAKLAARKIASEEFHQQVTTSSGTSNWDKVRTRYDVNKSSLLATP